MKSPVKNFLKNNQGATAVEYAVILFSIVLIVIGIIFAMANWDNTGTAQVAFNAVANKVKDFGRIE